MIQLSPAAASEVRRLQSKHPNPTAFFRLGVVPGSCADLAYKMEFDEVVRAGDLVYDCDGIRVVIDSQQLSTIDNLTLDYSEDLMGGGFRFHNPQAAQTCSCGNSFFIHKTIDTEPPKSIQS